MNSRRLACVLGAVLCCASVPGAGAPVDQAYERARATFSQKAPLVPNPQVLHADWQPAPFDPAPYTFTVEEIRANWDQFMWLAPAVPLCRLPAGSLSALPEFVSGSALSG